MKTHPTSRIAWTGAALLLLLSWTAGAEEPKPAPEVAHHQYVAYTIASPAKVQPFEKIDAKAAGIDPAALERLVKQAEETHSDALIVLQNGKLVGDWRFGKPAGPIEAMSVTKSVVNLAIGRLVTTGKLRIDEPVATFYPQWKGTPKKKITVRQLLDHTSGIQASPMAREVYLSRDLVKQALDAPLASEPGTVFSYNNKAVNLLAGIVEKVSGKKLDEYLRDEIFAPLGVTRFNWLRDPAGNPHCLAGVEIDPLDLAKIGQLMLDEGTFQGRRLVSAEWVQESVRQDGGVSRSGLLWWPLTAWTKLEVTDEVLDTWRKGGADPAFVEKMATLRGRQISGEAELVTLLAGLFGESKAIETYVMNVRGKGLPGLKSTSGPLIGFQGNGDLGQYVAVLPASRLVAVRMIRRESFASDSDGFDDFFQRVQELTAAAQQAQPAPAVQHEYVEFTVTNPAKVQPFEKVDPKAAGIDPAALDRLVKRAEETHSDALVVLQDGKLVGDWRFGKPAGSIEAMSATKSIVGLAIGRLVTTGKLKIDEPVATFYPEWKGTPKEKITIRNLLDHTSGLKTNPTTEEIYASRDVVKVALDAPLATPPGEVFFYNNKAVNLLAGIVEKVSGKKLDEYLRDELFAPLGISRFSWMRDASGNPHGMAGLQIDPLDFARIGQLMLDDGKLQGQQILSPEWVRDSLPKGGNGERRSSLLWWPVESWTKLEVADETLEAWRKGGADPAFVEKMATLRGKVFTDMSELLPLVDQLFGAGQGIQTYLTNVRAKGLPGLKRTSGPVVGFSANGFLGQYVAILPASRLVVVRMIRQESFASEDDNFGGFFQRVQELKPASAAAK